MADPASNDTPGAPPPPVDEDHDRLPDLYEQNPEASEPVVGELPAPVVAQ